jgi:dihydroxyacetone kinase DhaKLM complex PTS-EIIA-like component DhaM
VAVELGEAAAVIADAPLVEGAVAAAVTATDPAADLARVREEAERAGG